jgi:hypothetical protein
MRVVSAHPPSPATAPSSTSQHVWRVIETSGRARRREAGRRDDNRRPHGHDHGRDHDRRRRDRPPPARRAPIPPGARPVQPRILLLLPWVAGAIGCSEPIYIRSTPPGAKVTINNQVVGVTPVLHEVKRSEWPADNRFKYRVELEGYRPEEGEFRGQVSPGTIVTSILTTAGISLLFTGAMTLPSALDVDLEPTAPAAPTAATLPAAERLRRVEDLFQQGLISRREHERLRREILDEL